MTNRTAAQLPALLAFARPADDLEAQASLDAELEEARRAASLLGQADPFVQAACLLASAQVALERGEEAWALLDAGERVVQDLRLEHGGEDWSLVTDWTAALCDVAALDQLQRTLRQRARQQREARLARAAFTARRLAVLAARKAG
jgi:hypothetical protein